MILDRLLTASAINFVKHAIPEKSETGKNCLFVRVDEGKLVLTGGGEFVVKKTVLNGETTTKVNKEKLPEAFMIPISKLLAFETMLKKDKAECKKLAKNDTSHMHVEITNKKMVSYEGEVDYQQPKHLFKDLETMFQITKAPVSEIPIRTADIEAAVKGFEKSKDVNITFTGPKSPMHLEQGDFEAIVLPPVEKEEEPDGGEQTTIDD